MLSPSLISLTRTVLSVFPAIISRSDPINFSSWALTVMPLPTPPHVRLLMYHPLPYIQYNPRLTSLCFSSTASTWRMALPQAAARWTAPLRQRGWCYRTFPSGGRASSTGATRTSRCPRRACLATPPSPPRGKSSPTVISGGGKSGCIDGDGNGGGGG